MKVQCILCNIIEKIDDQSFIAKRYRNHPLKTHLCNSCKSRITQKAKARLERQRAKQAKKEEIIDYI